MRPRIFVLCLLASPGSAFAELPGFQRPSHASSQDFALELRVNYGKPEIDSAPGLARSPYSSAFGSESRVGLGAELDWQFLSIPRVGSLGVGVGVGRWSTTAKAVNYIDLSPTGDDTTLELWQFAGLGVFRVDALADSGIPLVPYVKAGLGYSLWRAYGPDGTYESKTGSGNRAIGGSYGFQWSGGLALHLDRFDPSSAKNIDETMGVNNTYLFVEYTNATLRSASSKTALWVGGNTFTTGLALEF